MAGLRDDAIPFCIIGRMVYREVIEPSESYPTVNQVGDD